MIFKFVFIMLYYDTIPLKYYCFFVVIAKITINLYDINLMFAGHIINI